MPLDQLPQRDAIGKTATTGPYCWGTILYFREGGQDIMLATGTSMQFARVADCQVQAAENDIENRVEVIE